MSKVSSYKQGTPNWIDLSATDVDASRSFYNKLFGWEYSEEPTDQGVPYIMARKDGAAAAGMMQQTAEQTAQGMPPMWTVYLAVDDAADAISKVEANGGKVVMPAMKIMESGTMGIIFDSVGAGLGLWQAANHIGCEVVNEHGAFTWSEVVTDKPERLDAFYHAVTGARFETGKVGDMDYTRMMVDGKPVGGTMPPQMEGTPPHWHVFFGVDDADVAAATATENGGAVVVKPFDTPVGRIAVLSDPQGAMFSVMKGS